MRSNAVVSTTFNHDGTMTFAVVGAGKFDFDPRKASIENRTYAAVHGFRQRISDGAAMSRDTETGASATPAQKLANMRRLAEHYESGSPDWSIRAAAEDSPSGLTIEAMVRAGLAKDANGADDLVAKLAQRRREASNGKMDEKQSRRAALAEWAKSDKVREAMEAIRAERAAAQPKVSANDLLAEIEAI